MFSCYHQEPLRLNNHFSAVYDFYFLTPIPPITKESIIDKTLRHSREDGNPGEKTGFPRIKYGAGLAKPGMTKQGECLYNYGLISKGGFAISKTFEGRLSNLIHEIKEIKKQIILDKSVKVNAAQTKIDKWKMLGDKISSNWDGLSAVDEIAQQREKT